MTDKPHGFWSSLQGILTGLAAVIAALTGLYIAINDNSPVSQASGGGTRSSSAQLIVGNDGNSTILTSSSNNEIVVKVEAESNQAVAVPAQKRVELSGETTQANKIMAQVHKPFPKIGPLVDCEQFLSVNSVKSLMSWSNYYHEKIVAANGVKVRASDGCNKAIDYRGIAHCIAPQDLEVREALLETLSLCREAGIEWTEIKHTTIIGN